MRTRLLKILFSLTFWKNLIFFLFSKSKEISCLSNGYFIEDNPLLKAVSGDSFIDPNFLLMH